MDERTFKTRLARSSEDVITFYDEYAKDWDNRFGNMPATNEFHHIRLKHFLQVAMPCTTDTAIELGVGTGPYLDVIAPLVKEIICVDGSSKMLEVLREKNKNLRNITVVQADLERLEWTPSVQADLLYCFGLFEHIINPLDLLAKCKKMLKPRGRFVVSFSNGRSPWYGPIRRLFRAGHHCSIDHFYSPEEFEELVRQVGFVPEVEDYWGYFPPGAGNMTYKILNAIGKVLDKTWFRRYAGSVTIRYVLAEK